MPKLAAPPSRILSTFLKGVLLLGSFCALPAHAAPDLDVTHISRRPIYFRYNVQYLNGFPVLAPVPGGNADPSKDKRWPDPGERVTFTAHVRNHGDVPAAPFRYAWLYDGAEALTGVHPDPIPPGGEATITYSMNWPSDEGDHFIRFTADPNAEVTDAYRVNNTLEDPLWGLSFSIWVEQGLYDRFNRVKNLAGTASFEDWFNAQFAAFRRNFRDSVYPLDPQGITEQIRVDKFVVVPNPATNPNLWRQRMDADPDLYRNDGRWQFVSERQTLPEKEADWDHYVREFAAKIDWGLIHELTHQLGIIDEYRMNLEWNQNLVRDRFGNFVRFAHIFPYGGLMGGGSVLPHGNGNLFSSHTAHALNLHRRFRRGYYGEYLWDIPRNNTLVFTDAYGRPLPNAQVAVFQKSRETETISNIPVMTGLTDAEGRFTLRNRPVPKVVRTDTGHFLNPNPFGNVSVVGENGLFLIRLRSGQGEDWRWMDLTEFNLAYWSGSTENATYPMRSFLTPGLRVGTANRALNRPARASVMSAQARTATDGNDATGGDVPHWAPSPSPAGTWWQVDLGDVYNVGQVDVFGGVWNPHDWFGRFRIQVSETGLFRGEQRTVHRETNWDRSRGWLEPGALGHGHWMSYHFRPVPARYVRLVADVEQPWVRLQEVKVFETAVPGDVTGDGTPTVEDAVRLLRAVVGLEPATPALRYAGDLTPSGALDGAVTVQDAVAALRLSLGMSPEG
jgi:hypothetical protein